MSRRCEATSIDLFGRNGWRRQKPFGIASNRELQTNDVTTYFCNLTEASSELGIARIVAKSMRVQLNDSDPVTQLGILFKTHPTILVLDNLEQVLTPIRDVITQWMTQSNTLRIIATSRIQLRMKPRPVFDPASDALGKHRVIHQTRAFIETKLQCPRWKLYRSRESGAPARSPPPSHRTRSGTVESIYHRRNRTKTGRTVLIIALQRRAYTCTTRSVGLVLGPAQAMGTGHPGSNQCFSRRV